MVDVSGPSAGRFSVGRVFSRTFAVLRGEAVSLAVLTALLGFLPTFLFGLLRVTGVVPDPGEDLSAAFRGAPGERVAVAVTDTFLLGSALSVTLAAAAGRRLSVSEALSGATQHFWRLLGINILVGLATLVGLLLLIVPGVWIYLRWMVAPAAQIAEAQGVTESMARAAQLSEGHRWALFGAIVVGLLVVVLLALAINAPLAVFEPGTYAALLAVNLVGDPLSAALGGLLFAVGLGAAYEELRTAREGSQVAEVFG